MKHSSKVRNRSTSEGRRGQNQGWFKIIKFWTMGSSQKHWFYGFCRVFHTFYGFFMVFLWFFMVFMVLHDTFVNCLQLAHPYQANHKIMEKVWNIHQFWAEGDGVVNLRVDFDHKTPWIWQLMNVSHHLPFFILGLIGVSIFVKRWQCPWR